MTRVFHWWPSVPMIHQRPAWQSRAIEQKHLGERAEQ
jgi:hypothetical protein